MLIGYARVSTGQQNLDLQLTALNKAGCEKIFTDQASGKNTDRAGLEEMFKIFRDGDTLIVWKLDRLGRSVKDLINILEHLNTLGVSVTSLTEGIDTQGLMGKVIYQLIAIFAELERNNIIERTKAGLLAARAQGRIGGRPKSLNRESEAQITELLAKGWSAKDIMQSFKLSKSTFYKYFPATKFYG